MNQANDLLFSYMGSNNNSTSYTQSESSPSLLGSIINQHDADLLHFLLRVSDLSIFLTNFNFFDQLWWFAILVLNLKYHLYLYI